MIETKMWMPDGKTFTNIQPVTGNPQPNVPPTIINKPETYTQPAGVLNTPSKPNATYNPNLINDAPGT
jgi:hypothetical protein